MFLYFNFFDNVLLLCSNLILMLSQSCAFGASCIHVHVRGLDWAAGSAGAVGAGGPDRTRSAGASRAATHPGESEHTKPAVSA